MSGSRFPDGFVWGAGTSAYQVEGGVTESGRGPSIWDTFSHEAGRIAGDHNADITADHFHRVDEDIDLMGEIGLQAYRFSIAWPRIQPSGRGAPNRAGIAFYDRLVDGLLEQDIAPCPTLYHWDLPQALEDAGGWLERDTVERFADYAAICFDALGDRIGTWFTVNEPWVASTLGYRLGIHAPGRRDLALAVRASHHLLLAHGAAVRTYRAASATGRIGIVLSLSPTYPATDADDDRAAAHGSDGYTNRWFLDAVLRGTYPPDMLELFEGLGVALDAIRPGDAARIGERSDFLGVNYYTRRVVSAGSADGGLPWTVHPPAADVAHTDTGWEITPACLTDLLLRLGDDHPQLLILVTENGGVFLDAPDPTGRIADAGRTAYIREHVAAIGRAIAAGVRVEGYFYWSLLDNFEWAEGFRSRFGLVHVDYPTGRRLLKDSARAYGRIIAANGLDDPEQ